MTTPLATIAPEHLDLVSGGASRAQKDERILDKIQSLATAVSDVAAQQKQPDNGGAAAALPLVALKAIRQRQM